MLGQDSQIQQFSETRKGHAVYMAHLSSGSPFAQVALACQRYSAESLDLAY